MPSLLTSDDLRRRRLVVVALAAVFLLIAAVTYAVMAQRSSARPQSPDLTRGPVERPSYAATPLTTELSALRPTSDPETFARDVAEALFAWDTQTLLTRADHVERLVAVADPTGESTPGLVSDLDNYLPTQESWVQLAQYGTRQWLTVDSATTPSRWAEAQAQAGDELLPGTTALTIDGTRHRSGVWEGEQVASAHDVTFTLFLVCGPSYPECHLLRLSMLDKPLE